jgi:hypothetical protein
MAAVLVGKSQSGTMCAAVGAPGKELRRLVTRAETRPASIQVLRLLTEWPGEDNVGEGCSSKFLEGHI